MHLSLLCSSILFNVLIVIAIITTDHKLTLEGGTEKYCGTIYICILYCDKNVSRNIFNSYLFEGTSVVFR